MKYVKFTQVDVNTLVSVHEEVSFNGPAFPPVEGLEFGFALKSKYPTAMPVFYGTAPDKADLSVSGILEVISKEDYDAAEKAEQEAMAVIAKEKKLACIVGTRHTLEAKGIVWNGFFIDTSESSYAKILGGRSAAQSGLRKDDAIWKCANAETGEVVYRPTTNEEMIEIGDLTFNYVQACFDREAQLVAAVQDGSFEFDMLSEGWPT
jgi:hypothetical protein